tara:strand:- start:3809 stop:4411 length:603 start_codon:yes stop_codon:yes gene_type:complete
MNYIFLIFFIFFLEIADCHSTICSIDTSIYKNNIKKFLSKHSIDEPYDRMIQFESCNLEIVYINQSTGRVFKLDSLASNAFFKMKEAAMLDSVEFNIISAYRSFNHQVKIIERKLKSGKSMESILKENTLPGYSQHHTGNAIDLSQKSVNYLSQSFDKTNEFKWLVNNADKYGFYLTYPKNNQKGIMYEPWHWVYIHNVD